MILGVAEVVQVWMVLGAIVLAAVAVVLVSGLGREAGMPQGWVLASFAISIGALASAALAISAGTWAGKGHPSALRAAGV